MIDPRSQKVIDSLLPKVQPVFSNCLVAIKKHFEALGVEAKYISGHRSWAEQDALYAQGRTKSGPIVTKSKGGESNHNFQIAADLGLFKDGKYLGTHPLYKQIGPIVARFPQLEWGGNWKFVDEPHIQFRTGKTLAQLRDLHAKGRSVV
jgi:peptidoglycan L-alanyl-D-glutamate endopeptidase CwlK